MSRQRPWKLEAFQGRISWIYILIYTSTGVIFFFGGFSSSSGKGFDHGIDNKPLHIYIYTWTVFVFLPFQKAFRDWEAISEGVKKYMSLGKGDFRLMGVWGAGSGVERSGRIDVYIFLLYFDTPVDGLVFYWVG